MTRRKSVHALSAFLLLATAAAGAGILAAIPASASAQGRVLGGFRDIGTDDAGVEAAAEFAAGEVGGSLQSVDSAQIQSVAGANYRLTITLDGGAVWQVVVYRNLQGGHSLTSSTQTSAGDGPDTGTNDGSDSDGNRSGTGA